MSKIAFVFPGQGSQTIGMGQELFEKYDIAKDLFKKADDVLGFSIKDMCFNGPEEELRKTFNTQPAILTVSVICHEILKEAGVVPEIVAGHSLGEYSALVAAGALNFEDAVHLVRQRGTFMQEAVPIGQGGMAAILGLERTIIIDICNELMQTGEAVQAVNFNCPGQVVIAGTTKGVEQACQLLKEAGARKTVILPVSAPFHSSLMKPASEKLALELDKITLRDASIPVVANVTGKILTKANAIKESLIEQAASPVKWEDCVAEMQKFGANLFVEVGPGKVLNGFNKKIDKSLINFNVENIESLEKTLDYFGEVR
ncbi:ACP S-malonyltransferase [Anaerosinus massiliensis]|uniref:ACP S-malonyltransferase n=1 Tax=Massilibacillus massiliensis TaxID=1806837 RepID=UPI000ACE2B4E|nr:ACP S-malonyltransferase [Massilibacillus massiliensis]